MFGSPKRPQPPVDDSWTRTQIRPTPVSERPHAHARFRCEKEKKTNRKRERSESLLRRRRTSALGRACDPTHPTAHHTYRKFPTPRQLTSEPLYVRARMAPYETIESDAGCENNVLGSLSWRDLMHCAPHSIALDSNGYTERCMGDRRTGVFLSPPRRVEVCAHIGGYIG
jgi:hypothetical protein